MLLPADDARRQAMRLANPLSDEEPLLRTTLLPGLLHALRRNIGRGNNDVGLFEVAPVFRPGAEPLPAAPRPPLDRRPTEDEVAALDAALPAQPTRVAVALSGHRELPGWWGAGRAGGWADAVDAARTVAREARVELTVRADQHAPWHPGRCAVLLVGDRVVGSRRRAAPPGRRVVGAAGADLRDGARPHACWASTASRCRRRVCRRSRSATQDVALVVDTSVPAAEVEAALRDGAGDLLESLRLFDVYRGVQVGEGKESLAYTLRFRAPDRTLTVDEVTAAPRGGRRRGGPPHGSRRPHLRPPPGDEESTWICTVRSHLSPAPVAASAGTSLSASAPRACGWRCSVGTRRRWTRGWPSAQPSAWRR